VITATSRLRFDGRSTVVRRRVVVVTTALGFVFEFAFVTFSLELRFVFLRLIALRVFSLVFCVWLFGWQMFEMTCNDHDVLIGTSLNSCTHGGGYNYDLTSIRRPFDCLFKVVKVTRT